MRLVAAGIALALFLGCSGAPDEETLARPLRLVASEDRADVVRLEWSLGPGEEPAGLLVLRDGEVIAELPSGAREFQDQDAAAAEVAVTDLVSDPDAVGVALSWTVVEEPGASHTYVVRAVGGRENRDSEPAVGARAIPRLLALGVSRGAEVLAVLPPGAETFHDSEIAAGATPTLRAAGTSASVELSWDDIPATVGGETYAYEVRGDWEGGLSSMAGPLEVAPTPARPEAFLIHRDGILLAELPIDSKGYEDEGATPGRLLAPGLGIRSENVAAVELMWSAPTAIAGPSHEYELAVRWEGDAVSRSDSVVVSRTAPVVSAFEIHRDGKLIKEVGGEALGFRDESAAQGQLIPTAFSQRGTREAVALSWAVGTGQRGRLHRYLVRAVPDAGQPTSSSEVEGSRTGPTALGFVLSRDGETIATLESDQREFLDTGAGAATSFTAPLLVAGLKSVTNTEGVWLRWTEPPGQGVLHRYEVRAITEIGPGQPAIGEGARRPAPSGYEMQRDGGPWVAVDAQPIEDDLLAYMDREAPSGELLVSASVDTHPALGDAFYRSDVSVIQPQFSSYRVRAVAGDIAGEPSDLAQARRRVGDVFNYQWQRSNSGEESDYHDLPFQTLSAGFDEAGPDEPTRYYRVKVRTAGADGVSPAVLAETDTFDQIAAFNEFNCGIRSSDGKRRCWGGSNSWGQAPIEPSEDSFDHISLGESFGCGIRRDDHKRICWGKNDLGQAPPEPSEVAFRHLEASYGYACGIRELDGRIECWGRPLHGQELGASATDSFLSLSAGMYHMCAIRESDHKVTCWGDNEFGRAPPGPSEDSFLQITSGKQATCGVRLGDQKVICWGNGLYGEAPPGPSEVAYESVAAGDMHMCGVRLADGLVQCWGMDDNCESSEYMLSFDPYSQVAGGFNHSCGILREDGRVVCWGLNRSGQAPRVFPAFPRDPNPPPGKFCIE